MNRTLKVLMIGALVTSIYAGPKEDFIEAVKTQCSKSEDEAKDLATPGRAGNVIQYKLCSKSPIDIGNNCKLNCTKDNASIGG